MSKFNFSVAAISMSIVLGSMSIAGAQSMTFAPEHFGKVDLPLEELGNASVETALQRRNLFFRVGRLREDDPLRKVSEAVFRLNLLVRDSDGERSGVTCTAWLVTDRHVITNHHCVPGRKYSVERAAVFVDYLTYADDNARYVEVSPEPLASNSEMDVALLELMEPLPRDIKPIPLDPGVARPGSRLVLIHHPGGQPKVATLHNCNAHTANKDPVEQSLNHVCDSLPGSSGGLLVDAVTLAPVGLHFAGGHIAVDPATYNFATATVAFFDAVRDMVFEGASQEPHSATERPMASSVAEPQSGPAGADRSSSDNLDLVNGLSDTARSEPSSDPLIDNFQKLINQ